MEPIKRMNGPRMAIDVERLMDVVDAGSLGDDLSHPGGPGTMRSGNKNRFIHLGSRLTRLAGFEKRTVPPETCYWIAFCFLFNATAAIQSSNPLRIPSCSPLGNKDKFFSSTARRTGRCSEKGRAERPPP